MTKNNSSLNSLNLYFQKVKKIKILTAEEEKELIKKAIEGDPEAFKKIIISNQKLVVKEALKYYFKEDNFLDLINEGNKGLIEALKRFDITRDNRFYTYALWWVRSEIRRYLSKNQNIISFPDIFYNDFLNFKKAYFNLSKQLKRRPSEEELAAELDLPIKKIKVMLAVPDEIVSLDKGVSDDGSPNLASILPDTTMQDPQEVLIVDSLRELINTEIDDLTEKETMVIRMRYGFKSQDAMRLREIAKQINMSPEGVRRIAMKALRKLRNKLIKQGIYGVLN